jgi:phosphoribosylanthranilate isomerase
VTWVKICGITNLEDALVAVEAGADAVGFVFHEKSPRAVTAEKAREIVAALPARVEKVGVFVGEPAERIEETIEAAGLTAVQVSGMESAGVLAQRFGALRAQGKAAPKLIFVVPPTGLTEAGVFVGFGAKEHLFAILFDSLSLDRAGGTGVCFDWESSREPIGRVGLMCRTLVAGGLTPANVAEAIATLRPWGVDVASGVEARPGKKHAEKVREFVKAAKEAGERR